MCCSFYIRVYYILHTVHCALRSWISLIYRYVLYLYHVVLLLFTAGWLDVRSHPLGISTDAIRITMYNHQPIEVIEHVRNFMREFQNDNMVGFNALAK